MEWYLYVLIPLGGLVAGFINTLAGSGSLITLPLLMLAGLPPTIANGTNRIAILLSASVALRGFHRHKMLDISGGARLSLPAIAGAILGASIAVTVSEVTMKLAIVGFLFVMFIILLISPERWLHEQSQVNMQHSWGKTAIFFLIGIYGGFIQAGVGVFLLTGLVLVAKYDLVRANAIKVMITLCFTVFALAVFIWQGKVDWSIGLLLASGNMTGAWIGTKIALNKGAKFIRILLIVVVACATTKLIYDIIQKTDIF